MVDKHKVAESGSSSSGCPFSIKVARSLCKMTCKSIGLFIGLVVVTILCVLSTSLKSTSLIRLLVECVSGNKYSFLLAIGYLCLQLSIYVLVSRWMEKKKIERLTQEQTTPTPDSSAAVTSSSRVNLRKTPSRRKLALDKPAKYDAQDYNHKRPSSTSSTTAEVTNQSRQGGKEEQKVNEVRRRRRNAYVYEDQDNFAHDSDILPDSEEENDAILMSGGQATGDTDALVAPEAIEFQRRKSDVAPPVYKLKHPNVQRMQTISWKSLDSGNFSESKEFLCDVKGEPETESYDRDKGASENLSLGSMESQQTDDTQRNQSTRLKSLDSGNFSESKEFLSEMNEDTSEQDQYKDIWSHDNMKKYFIDEHLLYGADIVAEYSQMEIEQPSVGVNLWDSVDNKFMFHEILRRGVLPETVTEEKLVIHKSNSGNIWLTSDHRRRFQMTDIVLNRQPLQASTTPPDAVKIPQTFSSATTLTRMCSESDIFLKRGSFSHFNSLDKLTDLVPSTISQFDDCCTVSTNSSRRSSVSGDSGTDCSAAAGMYSLRELNSQRSQSSQRSKSSRWSRNSTGSHLSIHDLEISSFFKDSSTSVDDPPIEPLVTNAESTPAKSDRSVCSTTTTRSSFIKLEEVIDHLQTATNATAQEEEPEDYPSFKQEIFRVCRSCDNLKLPLICPAPGDHHSILVQGPGVGKVKADLEELTRMCYSKYKIIVSDTEPAFVTSEGLAVYTNHFVDRKKMPFYLNKEIYNVRHGGLYEEDNVSTIGVFVKDNSLDQIFAVTSAHALTIDAEKEKLAAEGGSDHKTTRTICGNVIGRGRLDEKLSIKPHNEDSVNVKDLTLISYRLFIKSNLDAQRMRLPHQNMMTDIALLPVSRQALPGWIIEQDLPPIQSHLSLHPPNNNNVSQKHIIRVAGILNIQDPQEIGMLLGKRTQVYVEDTTGVIERQPVHDTNSEDWQIAHHIAFTTEKALMRGNSGSAVMVYNKDEDEFYVIAILMGQFKGNPQWKKTALYQAILLGPALKQLERLYPDKINGQLDLVCGNILLGSELSSVFSHLQKVSREAADSGFDSQHQVYDGSTANGGQLKNAGPRNI